MSYAIQLFERFDLAGAWRWLHVIAGIAWIGLLYYFNLVQVPAFAKMDASARNDAIDKVARRALWWFRWAALATVIFGLLITGQKDYFQDFFKRPDGSVDLHRDDPRPADVPQRLGRHLAQAEGRAGQRGQRRSAASRASARRRRRRPPGPARLAARTSSSRCRCCGSWSARRTSTRWGFAADVSSGKVAGFLIVSLLIIAVLEINALGLLGTKPGTATLWPYENHRNAIISAFVLWAILWLITELFFAA